MMLTMTFPEVTEKTYAAFGGYYLSDHEMMSVLRHPRAQRSCSRTTTVPTGPSSDRCGLSTRRLTM